jgi:hypothetical protein
MRKRQEKSNVLKVEATQTHQSLNCLWYRIENVDVKGQVLVQKRVGPIDRIIIDIRKGEGVDNEL